MNHPFQVALVFGLVLGSTLAAQDLPGGKLPDCDTYAPQSFPCVTPFDTPPVLRNVPQPGGGARKTPLLTRPRSAVARWASGSSCLSPRKRHRRPVLIWPQPISAGWARFADSQHLVLGRDEVKVKVRSARLGREITIQGFGVRVRLREGSGQEFNSYFAVFPEEPQYIKFRVTYPSGQRVQGTIDDFVKQVLEARAAEPAHCFSSS